MSEKLVTIASFSHVVEAYVPKSKLESEGIECFVANEHIVSMNWLYSNAVGGVKLQVRESDAERAIKILQQRSITTEPSTDGVTEEATDVRCPKCNSSDVCYERFSRRLVFASWLFLGVPLPFLKGRWTCRECGYQWKRS